MIEIKNLTKAFATPRGTITIFDDFNLTIKDGTFLGIAGKSGIGKSTLLTIIAGLQNADKGSVLFDGINILNLKDKERAAFRNQTIGFISQEQSFLENLTVLDNVRLPAYLTKKQKKCNQNAQNFSKSNLSNIEKPVSLSDKGILLRANELLSQLNISHLANQYPVNLSGGENHRVLIARALMNNPPVILADEPTDSVDEEQTRAIISIFKELASQGKTVIFVSHDLGALGECETVIKL